MWQDFALAGIDAVLADERLALANLRSQHATQLFTVAQTLQADVTTARGRLDIQRDTACREAQVWEEQIMFYDFLTARAQAFATFKEPPTRAAMGDFRWQLLDDSKKSEYLAESVTGAASFSGWSGPTLLRNHFLSNDTSCNAGGSESAARCSVQRSVLNQLLDTGLVRFSLEDGPSRFLVNTDRSQGRVTGVAASLLGSSVGSITAGRISHDAQMSFVDSSKVNPMRFSTEASRGLCEVI